MTPESIHRRKSRSPRVLCILTAGALSTGIVLGSPIAHARFQAPDEESMSPVFVEIDTASLSESEQPVDAAEADASALMSRIPELLEQRGIELAEQAGSGVGHLRVSVGWKYYRESIYQVQVAYTSPDGVEHTSDWTIEGIDSGDVIDEFDSRLDKYVTWFSSPLQDTSSTTREEPPRPKPSRAWLAVGVGGAALTVVGGALAVTGAVLDPEERFDSPTASGGSLGRSGTEDNGTRRTLVYSGAAVAGVGVVLAAVGFSLHFSKKAQRESAPRASIAPLLGGGVSGLSATGRF